MKVTKTPFEGLVVLEPTVFNDNRGYFFESYNYKTLLQAGIDVKFVQDNQSFSTKNVLRGMHFQKPPFAQTKLVRVLSGAIQDVVIDLRKEQPTYGRYFSMDLTDENKKQLLVPKGFAHGFLALSKTADILYKCDEFYHKESESGIIYNDSAVGIKWAVSESEFVLSEKDKQYSGLK